MNNSIPHPQADILRAIADGKTIQWKAARSEDIDEDKWEDLDPKYTLNCIAQYLGGKHHHFRIKPETKTGWIAIYPPGFSGPSGVTIVSDMYQTKQLLEIAMSDKPIAIIQITYTPGEGL